MLDKREWKGCAICTYMKIFPDPDPRDWFCDDDEKSVCTYLTDTSKGGPTIAQACRPYQTMSDSCYVPNWCPIGGIPIPRGPEFEENLKRFHGNGGKPAVIDKFEGDYFFLSNYYPCEISFMGYGIFNSSEAVYQGLKCPARIKEFIGLTPDEAKALGRKVDLAKHWHYIKTFAMSWVVSTKFYQHPDLAQKLIDTGNAVLIEGNTWGDEYWGQVDGRGKNMLGFILMDLREQLKWMVNPVTGVEKGKENV